MTDKQSDHTGDSNMTQQIVRLLAVVLLDRYTLTETGMDASDDVPKVLGRLIDHEQVGQMDVSLDEQSNGLAECEEAVQEFRIWKNKQMELLVLC